MATKYSNNAGGGDWSTGSTWSGGVAPTMGTDDVYIYSGDTVVYNLFDYTPSLGIQVEGLLSFDTTSSTRLTMGNATIAIGAAGELRIGTVGAVLDKSYTAEILWDTTTDATYGITVANGGKLTLYGDPAIYGGNFETNIADYCQVTGTLYPDVTGLYLPDTGDYPNGWSDHIVYKHISDGYYLWYDSDTNFWRLTSNVGAVLTYRWSYNVANSGLNVLMSPSGTATGTARVRQGWHATASTQAFLVRGNFSTNWVVGQELLIHQHGVSNNRSVYFAPNSIGPVTISSLTLSGSNTIVSVYESYNGDYNMGGIVLNLTRNIKLGKLNALTYIDSSTTNRPILTDENTAAGNTHIHNAILTGFYRIGTSSTNMLAATIIDSVIRNGEYGYPVGGPGTVDSIVYGCVVPVGLHKIDVSRVAQYIVPNY